MSLASFLLAILRAQAALGVVVNNVLKTVNYIHIIMGLCFIT